MKLYILSNNERKILLFNEQTDNIITTDFDIDLIRDLDFREFQKSLIVEFEIINGKNKDYSYINPYTGKLLMTNNRSTNDDSKSQMKWQEINKKWTLINWSNSDSVLDNIHLSPITFNLRIIWSNEALLIICKQPYIYEELNRQKYFIYSGAFLHDSINNLNQETEIIINHEIEKIKDAEKKIELKTNNILITCGSQAAGKSSYFNYINQPDESFINYENINYYNVDSDRYISNFSINNFLNNIPISYTNVSTICINSYKEIIPFIFQSGKYSQRDPHKHIEWAIEQWCLTNMYNFVKQGTSLWLRHMMDNKNYIKFKKLILFFWINKIQMSDRLNQRLNNLNNIRYFYDTVRAINSYDSDWTNSAKAIMIEHFQDIFINDTKYTFCFIFSDENKEKGINESSCFTINNNKFDIIKQGIMNINFFIKLLLYLTKNNLSELSKKDLIDGIINLPISDNLSNQIKILDEMLSSIPLPITELPTQKKDISLEIPPIIESKPMEIDDESDVLQINQKLGGTTKKNKRKIYKRKTNKKNIYKRKTNKRKIHKRKTNKKK
jgi:hypothetical protein